MTLFNLLILLIIIGTITIVIRSLVGVFRRTIRSPQPMAKFPTFSITMLSISLLLLIVGTLISLQLSDGLGNALASLGGFFGLLESNVRHKREAIAKKLAEQESLSE